MDEGVEEYEMMSCVRDYHIDQSIWDSCVGEMLHFEITCFTASLYFCEMLQFLFELVDLQN